MEKFPKRITIELTNKCNLDCVFCPRRFMESEIDFMDKELFCKIIDELQSYPETVIVPFFRGESLLHPDFDFFIEYMRKKSDRFVIQLATNAVSLDEMKINTILENKIDFLSFSLDTLNEDIYRKNRKGDLVKVTANINNLLKIKKERNLSLPVVQVSAVKTEETKDGIDDFKKYWKKRANRVRIYEEHSKDGHLGSLSSSGNEKREVCRKVLEDMVIYNNGNVAICNHDWERKNFIGNVGRNSIKEVWNSDTYNNIREMHKNNKFLDSEICSECGHWEMYTLQETNPIGEIIE